MKKKKVTNRKKESTFPEKRNQTQTVNNIIKPVLVEKLKNNQSKNSPPSSDFMYFNETLKTINTNLSSLSNQIESVRIELDEKISKIDEKMENKFSKFSDQMLEKNEKVNIEISNIKVIEGRIVPIVDELKQTVLEKDGLNERVNRIEQEKLISKTWMTAMFSIISIIISVLSFYFEKIISTGK